MEYTAYKCQFAILYANNYYPKSSRWRRNTYVKKKTESRLLQNSFFVSSLHKLLNESDLVIIPSFGALINVAV